MQSAIQKSWNSHINIRQKRLEDKIVLVTKRGNFTMIKILLYQEVTIINVCTPKMRAPKYIKQKLMEFERRNRKFNSNRNFNIPLSITDRTRQTYKT